jgi:hypothetical protein
VEPAPADLRQVLADLARGVGLDEARGGLTDEDEPGPFTEPYVREGELWLLGQHCLVVGDARDPDVVGRLAATASVDIVWTDPLPYGVAYEGAAGTIANDDLPGPEHVALLEAATAGGGRRRGWLRGAPTGTRIRRRR